MGFWPTKDYDRAQEQKLKATNKDVTYTPHLTCQLAVSRNTICQKRLLASTRLSARPPARTTVESS